MNDAFTFSKENIKVVQNNIPFKKMWEDCLHKKELTCPLRITLNNLFKEALKDVTVTGTKFKFLHLKIRLKAL